MFSFLVSSANDMGITWVSVQFPDTATAAPGAAPRLDAWQAQIQLRGSYPAVKRWLREAVGRYPNLVVQTARWAGSGPGSAPAAAETDVLDVQLQLVWLHRPASRPAGPAAAASVEGLLR